jgi:hypothetical protein
MITGKPITLTNNTGVTIPAFSLVAPGATSGSMIPASLLTNTRMVGTTMEDVANGATGLVVPFGLTAWMRFTSAPAGPGGSAWLSTVSGKAASNPSISSVAAGAQVTIRLGFIVKISSADNTVCLVTPLPSISLANSLLFGDKSFGPGEWTVYAVDYDGIVLAGNDATADPGVSNTMANALSAAILHPFKTLERVGQCLPRTGSGANIVVLVRPRAGGAPYRNIANNADQAMDWSQGMSGCGVFLRRGTLDFINDLNDKIVAGFLTGAGANVAGYNPTAGATVSSLPCQLAGGGAAGLPAETNGFSAISGYRIRFSNTTPTVALRNATAMVIKNTTTVITCSDDLPAVPATNDVFFLEQAGVVVGSASSDFLGWNHLTTTAGFRNNTGPWVYTSQGKSSLAGLESATGFEVGGDNIEIGNIGSTQSSGSAFAERTYLDETNTQVTLGVSIRTPANFGTYFHNLSAIRFSSGFSGGLDIAGVMRWAPDYTDPVPNNASGIGGGSWLGGITISRCPGHASQSLNSSFPSFVIGSYTNPNQRLLRMSNGTGGNGLIIETAGTMVYGIDFSNQTVHACIRIRGLANNVSIDNVVSPDGGNTQTVLDLTSSGGASGSQIFVGNIAPVTATAALGDIRLFGTIAPFSGLSIANYIDIFGNNIFGPTGQSITTTRLMATLASIPAFSVVRSTANVFPSDEITIAQADSAAHCFGVFGITLTPVTGSSTTLVVGPGEIVPIQFDGGGVIVGNLAYLSATTAGQASSTPPAAAGTNQKLALGYIVAAAAGSIGYVAFEPELRSATSNGATGNSKFLFNWVFSGNPDPSGAVPTWLSQSNFDAGTSSTIEFPIDEPITQVLVEGWLPAYGWGSSFPTLKLTKNGAVIATAYAVGSGTAGTVQFVIVTQSYARGDRLGLQLGSFGGGAITGSSLYTGRIFVIP